MVGKHVIIDLYDVEPNLMANINNNDILTNKWNNLLKEQLTNANVNCLNISWHNFDYDGAFTALYLLSESHLSIHTWPEKKYIALDIFTCGDSDIDLITNFMIQYFNPGKKEIKKICRGIENSNNNLKTFTVNNHFDLKSMDSVLYY